MQSALLSISLLPWCEPLCMSMRSGEMVSCFSLNLIFSKNSELMVSKEKKKKYLFPRSWHCNIFIFLSQSRDWTQVSHIAGRLFIVWATGKPNHIMFSHQCMKILLLPYICQHRPSLLTVFFNTYLLAWCKYVNLHFKFQQSRNFKMLFCIHIS